MILNKKEALKVILNQQGLLKKNQFGKGKTGTLNTIKKLSYIQIDTINVIERAHHHILWTRVSDYEPSFINKLVQDKKIYEYWAHAAAYLPIESYKYSLPRMKSYLEGENNWFKKDPEIMNLVLEKIKEEGPLKSKDFKSNKKKGGWWSWKPTKIALEQHFMAGTLTAIQRDKFQKVYDLMDRFLPKEIDKKIVNLDQQSEFLIKSSLRANGLVTEKEIPYLRNGEIKKNVKLVLKKLIEKKDIIKINIKGLNKDYYSFPESLNILNENIKASEIHILSPFDNLIIQRDRIEKLFNFKYRIECYVPKEKRIYGYFSLPILYGDKLIGLIDCKADRKLKTLNINLLHIFDEKLINELFLSKFKNKLSEFLIFNKCQKYILIKSNSKLIKKYL